LTVNGKGLVTAAGNIAVSSVAVTGITSTGAGNVTVTGTTGAVTLSLPTIGTGATTVGGSTSIPVITTDAYGRIIAVSTAAPAAQSFTLAGTTGTTTVSASSTLSFASTNGVVVTVGTEYANIATPQDIRTSASPTFVGLTLSGNLASTSTVYGQGIYDNGNRVVSTSTGAGNLTISSGAINLPTTGPGAVNVGSASYVPTIVTDAYGRIVSLTSNVISTTLSLSGTTGTGSVAGGGTLTFAGSYGETASVSGSTVTIGSAQDLRNSASPTFAGLTSTGTIVSSVINAGTIGNTGASIVGTVSTAAQNSITTMTGLTTIGSAGVTTTVTGNLYVGGNLTIAGNSVSIASSTLSVQDPIINLHTASDLTPLTSNDGADIGLKFHYYTVAAGDSAAFIGRANDTGYLEWYDKGTDTANVFTGTSYGTVKTGALILANPRVVGGGLTANTGTLQVWGDGSITGNLYAGAMYDGGNRTLNTSTTHSNSGGDVAVSGAYNAMVLTLNTVNTNVGTFGNATYNPALTINGKGLITAATTTLITPAWASITSTPTTISGYGITDALSTSSTLDGGTY
jgi:hypothetical protein